MRMFSSFILLLIAFGFCSKEGFSADQVFIDHCRSAYQQNKICPSDTCLLQCADGTQTPECNLSCTPRECVTFSQESCPKQFCALVVDCSVQNNCVAKTPPEQIPECTTLGNHPQEAECCKGLIKRCGFDYLDGKCNMQGKNTPYKFPVCIPCGDGVCTNFENHCNCPEDCKKEIINLN